jgi:GNAT superfamily N-acetyltransferase
MKAVFRHYHPVDDINRVGEFLDRTYPSNDLAPNWLRPRWEWMTYYHCCDAPERLAVFGIWEAGGEIVGLANFEMQPGHAYLQVNPDYAQLKFEMLAYAETAFATIEDGTRHLTLYVNEFDTELAALAAAEGYVQDAESPNVIARYDVAQGFPELVLPEGFRITDRQENNDLHKINRVLWRGFDHEGLAPEEYVAGRADDEKAPLFRPDLVVMIEAPDGNFASYCGIWYVPARRVAYVEPVATDPDYRRRGLGKVAVLEAVRRTGLLGATRAIVLSGQPFYKAIGFEPVFEYYPWHKTWESEG